MPKPNVIQALNFSARRSSFISTLKSEASSYRISDAKSLHLFNSNIDVILSILSLNYKCICKDHSFTSQEKTFRYETEDKFRYFQIKTDMVKCTELDLKLINDLITILLSVASNYKKFFAPYITELSKVSMDLDANCFTFPHLSKSFISLFKFYLDEVNYIDEVFVNRIMKNVYMCEYHYFFNTLCNKSSFVRIINTYNLVDMFLRMYEEGKIRVLHVLTNMLEIHQKRDQLHSKSSIDMKKMVAELANRGQYFLDIFLKAKDVVELNAIFNFLCVLLNLKISHYPFINAFSKAIEKSRILNFDEDSRIDNIQVLYIVHILSIIITHNFSSLYLNLETNNIIHNIILLFFKEENATFFHQTVIEIVKHIFSSNLESNYRPINIVLSVLEPQIINWGREFFARENEHEWNVTSLNAFTLELYKAVINLRKLCNKEYKKNQTYRAKEIMDRIDGFMKLDDFLFVKWYYERNIRSENLDLTKEKDFEAYFEDCISEAHIRYIYYMVIENMPYNKLFEN